MDYQEYISNIIFCVTGLILCTIDTNVSTRIALLIVLAILKIFVSYKSSDIMCLSQFIINEFLYMNFILNLWIIYNEPDNSIEYNEAFLWSI